MCILERLRLQRHGGLTSLRARRIARGLSAADPAGKDEERLTHTLFQNLGNTRVIMILKDMIVDCRC